MRAEVVNCFISAGIKVAQSFLESEIRVGKLAVQEKCCPSEELNIILGVLGKLQGQIIYGMTTDVARIVVSGMMGGAEVKELEEMAFSAIAEFSNMVSGNAAANLAGIGMECNITPPLLITGQGIQLNTLDLKTLQIPLIFDAGQLQMNVALEEV